MYNPFRKNLSITDILIDPSTNTPVNQKPKSLSELKELCDPGNNLPWVEKCLNRLPSIIKYKEENYKGYIAFHPRIAENEAAKEEIMKKTFNSYALLKHKDDQTMTSSLLACTNTYYTECVANLTK